MNLKQKLKKDLHDGIDTFLSKKVTLNERFDLYMKNKFNIKESTAMNYRYMYDRYVRNTLGRLNLADINTSKMKAFYTSLITEKGLNLLP